MKTLAGNATYLPLFVAMLCVSGCASVRSVPLPSKNNEHGGMVYYLPTQKIRLTLTIQADANSTRTVTATPTTVYADLSQRHVAQYRRNQIGQNALTVSVDPQGLLSGSASGKNTPQIANFIGKIAATPDIIAASTDIPEPVSDVCSKPGTYEWVFDAFGTPEQAMWKTCNIKVTFDDPQPQIDGTRWRDGFSTRASRGFFYRQKRPVQMTVQSGDERRVFVFSIVDGRSSPGYLPIPRTLFAESEWKVTFSEGSPMIYEVNSGGDLMGLVNLPAEVLHAYSAALLSGLNDRKDLAAAEKDYLQELSAIAAQQAKYTACMAAVRSRDDAAIRSACN